MDTLLKVDQFHQNPNIPIINGEPAYRDIPDVKDDWYEEMEDNKYREVLNIQSQIEAINNEIAFLQVTSIFFRKFIIRGSCVLN